MSEDDNSGLTRRRVLGGIATVGAASAAAGAGTMAYFSDTEQSTGNTVTAGTLDLTVNGTSDIGGASVDINNVAPGMDESYSLNLGNAGSIGGDLYVKFDVTGSNDGDGDGSGLEDDLDLTWSFGGGSENSVDLTNAPTSWTGTGQSISGGGNVSGTIGLEMPADSVGNEAQGESVTIDVKAQLVQSGGSPN